MFITLFQSLLLITNILLTQLRICALSVLTAMSCCIVSRLHILLKNLEIIIKKVNATDAISCIIKQGGAVSLGVFWNAFIEEL